MRKGRSHGPRVTKGREKRRKGIDPWATAKRQRRGVGLAALARPRRHVGGPDPGSDVDVSFSAEDLSRMAVPIKHAPWHQPRSSTDSAAEVLVIPSEEKHSRCRSRNPSSHANAMCVGSDRVPTKCRLVAGLTMAPCFRGMKMHSHCPDPH